MGSKCEKSVTFTFERNVNFGFTLMEMSLFG